MNDQVKKNRFLKEFLVISSINGWNLDSFEKTKKKLKFNSDLANKLFTNKLDDLILFYNFSTNDQLSKIYTKRRFNKKSIRLSILNAIKIKFELLNKNKDSVKKSSIFLSNPSKQFLSGKIIYKTVDHIWKLIGDLSNDYNFYTKRAILASIYSFAMIMWLNDKNKNLDKTFNFLEKSIMNMNVVSNIKSKLKETINQFL
tara:strand:- start:2359 stop:2958 length:600 start_codon:yes stop_codon:yes gene_type:complete